jgi:hypothetical protein
MSFFIVLILLKAAYIAELFPGRKPQNASLPDFSSIDGRDRSGNTQPVDCLVERRRFFQLLFRAGKLKN